MKFDDFSMHEFSIIKAFSIEIHPRKAKYIKEVLWRAPRLAPLSVIQMDLLMVLLVMLVSVVFLIW